MTTVEIPFKMRLVLIFLGLNAVAVGQSLEPEPVPSDGGGNQPTPSLSQPVQQPYVLPGPTLAPAFANIGLFSYQDRGGTPRPSFAIGSVRTAPKFSNVYPDYLLPAPADPNSMHSNAAVGTTQVSPLIFSRSTDVSTTIGSSDAPDSSSHTPVFAVNYGFQLRPGVYYDTNFAGQGAFAPGEIPTGPSHKAGQLSFNGGDDNVFNGVPFVADLGAQTIRSDNTGTIQVHLTGVNNGMNTIYARNAYAQWVDPTETHGLVFGKAETLFGDQGGAPTSIMTGALPIGAVAASQQAVGDINYTGVSQFRYSYFWYDAFSDGDHVTTSASVEDQNAAGSDAFVMGGDSPIGSVVNRYPTLVGRIRYSSPNNFDSYQVAALAREMVYNDANYHDQSATGWGVSGNARFALGENKGSDAIYLGTVAGQGIGGYIFGGTNSAVGFVNPAIGSAQQFTLYNNYGAYASYRRVWWYKTETEYWSSNFMYGHVYGTPCVMPGVDGVPVNTLNKNLNQFGCNLIWHAGDSSSLGLEYQYGTRLVAGGAHGDDHRIMFVLSLATGVSQTRANASTVPSDMQSLRAPPVSSRPTSRISSLRF